MSPHPTACPVVGRPTTPSVLLFRHLPLLFSFPFLSSSLLLRLRPVFLLLRTFPGHSTRPCLRAGNRKGSAGGSGSRSGRETGQPPVPVVAETRGNERVSPGRTSGRPQPCHCHRFTRLNRVTGVRSPSVPLTDYTVSFYKRLPLRYPKQVEKEVVLLS